MAPTVVVDLEAAHPTQALPVQEGSTANENSSNREAPALPDRMEQMQHDQGLRNRLNPGQSSDPSQNEVDSPVDTVGTLTPGSSEDHQDQEAFDIAASRLSLWQKRAASFASTFISLTDIEKHPKRKTYLEDARIITEKVKDFPEGLSAIAALRNSNESFSIYRKFGFCHSRVLTQLEVEISEMEKLLLDLEKEYTASGNKNLLREAILNGAEDTPHRELLHRLQIKLGEYDRILIEYNQVHAFGKPPTRDYESFLNWMMVNKPLKRGYGDFVWHMDDFVSVVGHPGGRAKKLTFFDHVLGNWLKKHPRSIFKKLLQTPTERVKMTDGQTNHYSKFWYSVLVNTFFIVIAVGSITIPVTVFFLGGMSLVASVVAIHVFVALFAVEMLVLTGAALEKVFIGTVSFGALLAAILASQNQTFKLAGGPQ